MQKLEVRSVFVNPKKNYSLVDEQDDSFYRDENGIGYLVVGDKVETLVSTFMVEGATSPVWFKKLKEMGIIIDSTTKELVVESINEDQFSYKQSDDSFTQVPFEKVLTGTKGDFFALIDGVIKKLYKRSVKKYTIAGVNVGNEYQYKKLLGFELPIKK